MRSGAIRIQRWNIRCVFIVGIIANLGKRCNGKLVFVPRVKPGNENNL
jgi:hypothetical protein